MPTSRSVFGARAVTALAFVTGVASCSAPPSSDGETSTTSTTSTTSEELTIGASTCPASTTYGVIKFVAPDAAVACPVVAGVHGTWVSSTGYPGEACTATRDPSRGVPVFCTYEWTPSRLYPHAPPEDGVLESIPNAYEAPFGEGGETTCEGPSSLPHAALLDRAGVVCPLGPHRHDGPAACTVCGMPQMPGVRSGVVFLPRTSPLRTITVELSNRTQRIVTFDVAKSGTRTRTLTLESRSPYVEIRLPPPPPGLRYVDGPTPGYAYGHPNP